jgi:nucleotide-binding universal stress UspA family protein
MGERAREKPAPSTSARVLVAVDLSSETENALRCAEELRVTRPAAIDVFYLWSEGSTTLADAADRARAAIVSFARTCGAWDRLDRLDLLERRGVIRVPGWLTRTCHGGSSLTEIAGREGYDLVVVGLAQPPQRSHRFDLHRNEPRMAGLLS